jgi:AcrR family transcriptional regulator
MRRTPGDAKSESLVRAVVDAAIAELAAHGHAGLTTNRVAERAGVSIGSLYQYFPNKEAIAAAVFERYLQSYTDVFLRALHAPGATYGELLQRIVVASVDAYRAQPRIHRYLFELQSSTKMHDRIGAMIGLGMEAVTALFRATGMTDERAREIALVLAHSFVGVCIAVFQHAIENPSTIADRFIAMARGYLRQLGIEDVAIPPGFPATS